MSNELLTELRQILLNVHGLDAFATGSQIVGKITALLPPFTRRGAPVNPNAPKFRIRVETDYGDPLVGIFEDDAGAIAQALGVTIGQVQSKVTAMTAKAKGGDRNQSFDVSGKGAMCVLIRSGRYWNFMAPFVDGMEIDPPNFFPENAYQPPAGQAVPSGVWGTPAPGSETGTDSTTTEKTAASPEQKTEWSADSASPSEGW